MHANLLQWQRSPSSGDLGIERRDAPRCEIKLPVVIRFSPGPLRTGAMGSARESSEIIGETRNLSETGMAVCVPANRIGNRYLNVIGCKLSLQLTIPTGPIKLMATPRWFITLAAEEGSAYLIGLRVTEMDDEQWVKLVRFVRGSLK